MAHTARGCSHRPLGMKQERGKGREVLFQCKKGSIPSWSSIIAQHADGPVGHKEVSPREGSGRALHSACGIITPQPVGISGQHCRKSQLNPSPGSSSFRIQ